ncbi:DEAD/DEAH box helicase family protein [Candidatus Saccharibacteria bacterium]|nr:DEAD/DEAH box helicase family protein [Candidatus Saccharibacteria bacterium]
MAKIPRKYQIECLEALTKARKEGKKKALVVMASGLGKTLTAVFDVKEFLKDNPNARVLVLCHSADILGQIKEVFRGEFGDEYSYGMYNTNEKATHRTDFLFANLQSVYLHRKEFDPKEFDYVIVDEAHHSQAVTYRRAVTYFKPEFLLGLTATPGRMDGLDIEDIFEETVYSYSLYEAILDGWLARVNHVIELDDLEERLDELKKVSESGETLSVARLNREFFVPKRDEEIAKVIKEKLSFRPNATTVIFCQTIEHAERFAKLMDAVVIHSSLSVEKRTARLDSFRNRVVKSICAVDLLNEGIDVPSTDVIVFLRTTQSTRIILQQLGRGLRRADNKDEVLVLDFVGNVERLRQIKRMKQEFEDCLKKYGNSTIKEPYKLNINTSKFKERQVDILQILENAGFCRYSDEELIELLQTKAKSLGRTPTKKDVDSDNGMPSSDTYANRFGSWNKALEAARLSPSQYRRTDKELIDLLKAKAESLGRTPMKNDIRLDSNMPNVSIYARRFGSWKKALRMAGLLINRYRISDEKLIELLKAKAKSLGRTPTEKDIKLDSSMPSSTTYAKRFDSWNQALEAAGLLVNHRFNCADEKLITLLRAKAESLGRTPTKRDIKSDSSMPSYHTYISKFGSWNKVLEAASLSSKSKSDEELIEILKAKARSLGRTPTSKDIRFDSSMPSSTTYATRFGSWNQALEAAGLSPNRLWRK